MKKLMVLSAAAIMLATAVNAQNGNAISAINKKMKIEKKEIKTERKTLRKLEGREVSYQSKQHFLRDFRNAPIISSERSNNFDEFTFTKSRLVTRAYYDADANLVGTTQMKKFSDLPADAQKEIGKMYNGYTATDVILFDDNQFNETDMLFYNNQFQGKDSYFVELQKDNKKIVVQVSMAGEVSYFSRLR